MRLTVPRVLERGDTIIEVIFAVVIFALVAISSLTIMNQGVATAERALEVTLVRQQMDAQAEALRFIHGAQLSAGVSSNTEWSNLKAKGQQRASDYGVGGGICRLPGGGGYNPFILNARTAKVSTTPPTISSSQTGLPPYPQVVYDDSDSSIRQAYGLWIEAVPSDQSADSRFVDFHIRACWDGPGSSAPMTLGTIVRLYDPR